MGIYDGNHVRPAALHVLGFEQQLKYPLVQDPGLCDKRALPMAYNCLDVP